jgi:hypothetical protein
MMGVNNFFLFRAFRGFFNTPVYVFPRKCSLATSQDIVKYSPLLEPDDQLSDIVVIKGTTYRPGYVVITQVYSADVLQVGEILKIVIRKNGVCFLVTLSEAARRPLGFFESLPLETVSIVSYLELGDYKPLMKRTDSSCYPFVLHHHVVPTDRSEV